MFNRSALQRFEEQIEVARGDERVRSTHGLEADVVDLAGDDKADWAGHEVRESSGDGTALAHCNQYQSNAGRKLRATSVRPPRNPRAPVDRHELDFNGDLAFHGDTQQLAWRKARHRKSGNGRSLEHSLRNSAHDGGVVDLARFIDQEAKHDQPLAQIAVVRIDRFDVVERPRAGIELAGGHV